MILSDIYIRSNKDDLLLRETTTCDSVSTYEKPAHDPYGTERNQNSVKNSDQTAKNNKNKTQTLPTKYSKAKEIGTFFERDELLSFCK